MGRKGPLNLDVEIDANGHLVPIRSLRDFAIRFYVKNQEEYGLIAYNNRETRSRTTLEFYGYKKSRNWLIHEIGCTRKELNEAFYGYLKAMRR